MRMAYADCDGRVFDAPDMSALGRTGSDVTELQAREWIPLPKGATLVGIPGSRALGLDPKGGALKALPKEFTAVGALLPQGYTRLYLPAYHREPGHPLPLFGYTAVGYSRGKFYVAAAETDDPDPWNPLQYGEDEVRKRVLQVQQDHGNPLYEHLAGCALNYECVTARNTFFFSREAALPVSSSCNAGCIGCISEQPDDAGFPSPQTRLEIRPSAADMADLIVNHLRAAGPEAIISFGQGCEGEPSLRAPDIAEAIRRAREMVRTGYININTNAGFTRHIKTIVDAGLDLMRISTISALEDHYTAYYRPRGYTLRDVEASAAYASSRGVTVSLNYLVFPGASDRDEEMDAMIGFIQRTGVRLVQLRNLNIDPDHYLARIPARIGEPRGLLEMIERLRASCPGLRIGSYTHPPTWSAGPRGKAGSGDRENSDHANHGRRGIKAGEGR